MSRFVRPETTTLPISGGDTLTVRQWLTEGERRAAYSRMYHAAKAGEARSFDGTQYGIELVLAYLLDWSLTDDEGRQVIIRDQPREVVQAALDQLFPDEFAEIREAIDAHVDARAAERQEKKRTRAGAGAPAPISRSAA